MAWMCLKIEKIEIECMKIGKIKTKKISSLVFLKKIYANDQILNEILVVH